jgi:hypothetical protein
MDYLINKGGLNDLHEKEIQYLKHRFCCAPPTGGIDDFINVVDFEETLVRWL